MSDTKDGTQAVLEKLLHRMDHLLNAQRRAETATLTAALLGSRRKSLSINELLNITRDIHFARHPQPHNPEYQEWEKTKDERLNFIYK